MSIILKILIACTAFTFVNFLLYIFFKEGKAGKMAEKVFYGGVYVTVFMLLLNIFIGVFFKGAGFASPGLMWLMVPVILICALRAFGSKLFEPALTYNIPGKVGFSVTSILFKYLTQTLVLLGLVFAVVALARPQDRNSTVLPPTEGIDIMLTLDTSESMKEKDFFPNRITAAKDAAKNFIENRKTDRIGIVVFATDAMLQSPLTLDYDALLDYLAYVRIGVVNSQSTSIGDALAVSISHLEKSLAKNKIIILLTDGESNDGAITPLDAAKTAKNYGIKIYTIATVGPNYSPDKKAFDGGELREIAAITGGQYYRAYNNEELFAVYDTINRLEKTKFENLTAYNYNDRYLGLLAFALMLLCAAFILDKTVFVRLP